jgi:hypothetical protein
MKLTIVPKRPLPVDPWDTKRVLAKRTTGETDPMLYIPIQVVLDTFLVYARAGKPIDVIIKVKGTSTLW